MNAATLTVPTHGIGWSIVAFTGMLACATIVTAISAAAAHEYYLKRRSPYNYGHANGHVLQ